MPPLGPVETGAGSFLSCRTEGEVLVGMFDLNSLEEGLVKQGSFNYLFKEVSNNANVWNF